MGGPLSHAAVTKI